MVPTNGDGFCPPERRRIAIMKRSSSIALVAFMATGALALGACDQSDCKKHPDQDKCKSSSSGHGGGAAGGGSSRGGTSEVATGGFGESAGGHGGGGE
jgi:hypothetical protein